MGSIINRFDFRTVNTSTSCAGSLVSKSEQDKSYLALKTVRRRFTNKAQVL